MHSRPALAILSCVVKAALLVRGAIGHALRYECHRMSLRTHVRNTSAPPVRAITIAIACPSKVASIC
eukprot:12271979-Alexandrium_andersonii.AAC.1